MGKTYICKVWAFEVMDERDQNYDGRFGRETEPPAELECQVYLTPSSKLCPTRYPVKFLDAMKFAPWQSVRMVPTGDESLYTDFKEKCSFSIEEGDRNIGIGYITAVEESP